MTWVREAPGLYRLNGWTIARQRYSGRSQSHAFARTPDETKARTSWNVFAPGETLSKRSGSTLASAKVTAERRMAYLAANCEATPPNHPVEHRRTSTDGVTFCQACGCKLTPA